MATILNNVDMKTLQKKKHKITVCRYCYNVIPLKHTMKCTDCKNVFCRPCLTNIDSNPLCNDCLVEFVREKIRWIITK